MKLKSVVKTKYQDIIVYDRVMKQLPRASNFEYMVSIDYEELDTLYYYFGTDEQATSFANLVVQTFTSGHKEPRGVTEYINQLYVMVVNKHETKTMG